MRVCVPEDYASLPETSRNQCGYTFPCLCVRIVSWWARWIRAVKTASCLYVLCYISDICDDINMDYPSHCSALQTLFSSHCLVDTSVLLGDTPTVLETNALTVSTATLPHTRTHAHTSLWKLLQATVTQNPLLLLITMQTPSKCIFPCVLCVCCVCCVCCVSAEAVPCSQSRVMNLPWKEREKERNHQDFPDQHRPPSDPPETPPDPSRPTTPPPRPT